jgi:uncharacterized protein YbaP (TraB family)
LHDAAQRRPRPTSRNGAGEALRAAYNSIVPTLHTNRRAIAVVLATWIALTGLHLDAAGRNFMWKATSPSQGVVYLVGSVHLLTPEYYPLDPAFDDAFKASDVLVEELDMQEMVAANSQMEMLTRGMLPAGQTLDKVLSAETMNAVVKRFSDLGMPFEPMKQFKPWLLSLILQGFEWQKAGFDADLGLDKHFYDLAVAGGKRVQGLETLAFQLSRFDEMSMDMQDHLLAETLKELETTKTSFVRMADAWKAGDAPTIERLVLKDLKSEPQMYDRLLIERNRTWLPKIEALFSRPKPAFVVVGAAHLVGPDGLLQMLKAKGYKVEQL